MGGEEPSYIIPIGIGIVIFTVAYIIDHSAVDTFFSTLISPTSVSDMSSLGLVFLAVPSSIITFAIGAVFIFDIRERRAISKLKLGDKISFDQFGEGTYMGPSEIKPFVKVQFPNGDVQEIDVFGRSVLAKDLSEGKEL